MGTVAMEVSRMDTAGRDGECAAVSSPLPEEWRYRACCFAGLVILFLNGWLLNRYAFPLYDQVNIYIREISTLSGAIALMVVALIATYRPSFLHARMLFAIIMGFLVLGGAPVLYGLVAGLELPLIVGAVLIAIAKRLIIIVVGIACIRMPLRTAGVCVSSAYVAAFILRGVFLILPATVCIIIYAVLIFVAPLLTYPWARATLDAAFSSESPADRAVTKPSTFLPFNHRLFIALLVFAIIYGYALTSGETERVPVLTFYAGFVFAAIAIMVVVRRGSLDPDALFIAAALLVIAGFLAAFVPSLRGTLVSNTLVNSGIGCFDIFTYFILIALGSRNREASVATYAWGSSLPAWGVVVGAQLGRLANGVSSMNIAAAIVLFAFIAYIVIAFRHFSFKESIASVTDTERIAAPVDLEGIDGRCAALGERYGLTSREQEVFELLAHGRNARFVQEELTVSYNTVKVHVRHIYEKLDIHSQQELIDLVERG